jgi:hypothetical protein
VARTMVDRALADELRAACLAVALDLGGWNQKTVVRGQGPGVRRQVALDPGGSNKKSKSKNGKLMLSRAPDEPSSRIRNNR